MAEETQGGFVQTIGIVTKPHTVRVAQALGLTLSAIHAGQTAGSTLNALPAILRSPASLLARQWRILAGESEDVKIGSFGASAISGVFGAGIAAWCASREPASNTVSFGFFSASSLLLFSTIPYTYFLVRPTVDAIKSRTLTSSTSSSPSEAVTSSGYVAFDGSCGGQEKVSTFSEFTASVRRDRLEDLTTHQLVDRWGWWNIGRAALFALGAGCMAGAIVSEDISIFALFTPVS